MNEKLYCKLLKDNKIPIKGSNFTNIKELKKLEEINISMYNVGLPCGANNLIVLDIDAKDNGIEEWEKYILEYGIPKTVCETTPNGGLHFYFIHHSTNYTIEEIEFKQAKK